MVLCPPPLVSAALVVFVWGGVVVGWLLCSLPSVVGFLVASSFSSGFSFSPSGAVAFGGSRALAGSAAASFVSSVVSSVVSAGCSVRVGCAVGADSLVVSSVVSAGAGSRLSVFCVGGVVPPPPGSSPSRLGRLVFSGFWRGSAVSVLPSVSGSGGRLVCWAGGSASVPLPARLLSRSLASLSGASAFVLFLARGCSASSGSLRVAAAAVGLGLPVVVFSRGVPPLLSGVPGAWVSGSFAGRSCWGWSSVPVGSVPLPGF